VYFGSAKLYHLATLARFFCFQNISGHPGLKPEKWRNCPGFHGTFFPARSSTPTPGTSRQGCQIVIGTTYQNGQKKMYQIDVKFGVTLEFLKKISKHLFN
jgi:hypothetical protein